MSQKRQEAEQFTADPCGPRGYREGPPQDIALATKFLYSYDGLDNQATWKLFYYHLNMISMLTKEKEF